MILSVTELSHNVLASLYTHANFVSCPSLLFPERKSEHVRFKMTIVCICAWLCVFLESERCQARDPGWTPQVNRTLVLIILAFVLTWLPFSVIGVLYSISQSWSCPVSTSMPTSSLLADLRKLRPQPALICHLTTALSSHHRQDDSMAIAQWWMVTIAIQCDLA